MAKKHTQIRQHQSNNVTSIEHREIFDDNLLPDPLDIERLNAIDNDILPWLKQKADKEQDFRHGAYIKRLDFHSDNSKREHNTARFGVTIYFLLVLGCMGISYLLIRDEKNVQGTVFGGVGIILALAVLVTKKPSQNEKPK